MPPTYPQDLLVYLTVLEISQRAPHGGRPLGHSPPLQSYSSPQFHQQAPSFFPLNQRASLLKQELMVPISEGEDLVLVEGEEEADTEVEATMAGLTAIPLQINLARLTIQRLLIIKPNTITARYLMTTLPARVPVPTAPTPRRA